MSYSNKTKEMLAKKKSSKKCCNEAALYGLSINSQSEADSEIKLDFSGCHNCVKHFFRGLFISTGNISDPKKSYHLEFAILHENLALAVQNIANEENIFFKYVKRRNKYILYLKSSEQIEDFLYYIGAPKISFDLMETKILKNFRNNANRVTNFENANLEKVSKASAEQIEAVKLIIKKGKFDSLPEELQQTAKLRLKHIEMSIREIAEISNPHVSKSGIKHRMQKIIDIAKELY